MDSHGFNSIQSQSHIIWDLSLSKNHEIHQTCKYLYFIFYCSSLLKQACMINKIEYKCTMWWFDIHVQCEAITIVNTPIHIVITFFHKDLRSILENFSLYYSIIKYGHHTAH